MNTKYLCVCFEKIMSSESQRIALFKAQFLPRLLYTYVQMFGINKAYIC